MKKIKNWLINLWISFITELQDRVLMSRKRIIKFIGIIFVPIIYGVVCLVAFWNPMPNIGNAPTAIMDNDHPILIVENVDISNKKIELGVVNSYQDGDQNNINLEEIYNNPNQSNQFKYDELLKIKLALEESKNSFIFSTDNGEIKKGQLTKLRVLSAWELIKSKLLPKTDIKINDENYQFSTPVITEGLALRNIRYISNANEISKQWEGSKYYLQAKIENNYLSKIVNSFGKLFNSPSNKNEQIDIQPLKIWTTFERNFIFGYYMNTFSNFAKGMFLQSIPGLIIDTALDNVFSTAGIKGEQIRAIIGNEIKVSNKFNEKTNYILLNADLKKLFNFENNEQKKAAEKQIATRTLFGTLNSNGTQPEDFIPGKFINQMKNLQFIFELINKIIFNNNSVIDINEINQIIFKILTGTKLDNKTIDFSKFAITNSDKTVMNQNDFIKGINHVLKENGLANSIGSLIRTIILKTHLENELDQLLNTKWVDVEIRGKENGLYGIGLGEFFLVIGIWIGVLMQTFIYDRAKRRKKSSQSTWYLSKTLLMLLTTFIQVTAQVWMAYAFGWNILGLETILYVWIFLIASGFMFVILIQALWFLVKDESVGKFLVVLVMVLSLASGGGTFPAFSQFKFFEIISYLVPFTYVLKGLGAIVFGVPELGTNPVTTNVVLINFSIIILFVLIFLTLGLLVGARNRHKDILFGSFKGKKILIALKELKRSEEDINSFANGEKKFQKYNWKSLGAEQDLELYRKVKELYPFEGTFKWWKNKDHDKVVKPNETDDDIISRNE
ncbi:hypothetical protein ESOMN_v1c03710 [Williamsoniiplasma somnilux]|uniref:ABC-2 type transporter transmembrane domain-containing protein n=1 Tax=Williamsoniiplasma somnilux TaxID=215578 RepID=A0A2K8P1H5_9MOLU|nr:ABC transporter permease [Williamsoniiplasma somnilux]ATZ18753.1 hypothetical protein ESOMN_v1c03710 [Williamsoniiplasma somnilux]